MKKTRRWAALAACLPLWAGCAGTTQSEASAPPNRIAYPVAASVAPYAGEELAIDSFTLFEALLIDNPTYRMAWIDDDKILIQAYRNHYDADERHGWHENNYYEWDLPSGNIVHLLKRNTGRRGPDAGIIFCAADNGVTEAVFQNGDRLRYSRDVEPAYTEFPAGRQTSAAYSPARQTLYYYDENTKAVYSQRPGGEATLLYRPDCEPVVLPDLALSEEANALALVMRAAGSGDGPDAPTAIVARIDLASGQTQTAPISYLRFDVFWVGDRLIVAAQRQDGVSTLLHDWDNPEPFEEIGYRAPGGIEWVAWHGYPQPALSTGAGDLPVPLVLTRRYGDASRSSLYFLRQQGGALAWRRVASKENIIITQAVLSPSGSRLLLREIGLTWDEGTKLHDPFILMPVDESKVEETAHPEQQSPL